MKKIGIVTFNDYLNYGNRLQVYALQYFLKNNFSEFVFQTVKYRVDQSSEKKRLITRIMSNISLKKIITKLGNLLKRRKMKKLKSIKEQNLRLFSKKIYKRIREDL